MRLISRERLVKDSVFFLVAAAVTGLDQLSKYLIRSNMYPGQSIPEDGFFRIVYGTNPGGVFGLFANQTFLITIAAVISVVIILLYSRHKMAQSLLVRVSLGLVLGGSVGNLIDRVRFGEVTDFIRMGSWPVFNLADAAIDVGIVLLLYYVIFKMRKGE
ncbi:MAG: signal peptidase II [Chloroflexota bacterium]|nr:signal peptidase II [Chloroflexota bacterium]